ncbi:3-oxoacyl-ACP reductase family protein [Sodalis sp. RH16]|uniref:3-oxoacyl-ACP reductase family protein n=1 Tax=Sodalis sp. RH16 TaxID=3394331 RepID=UPI0039B62DAA
MTKILLGKVALVTGGSRGIGAAIVRRLAADGAAVAFTFAASEERALALVAEVEALGGKVLAIKADSGDAEAVRRAVARTAGAFGVLDILVNNAGILIHGKVDEFTLEDFDRMVDVNVRAVFVAVQAAIKHMTTGGRIITTGSVVADYTGFPGASIYSMTKGAVSAMTRGFARDLGPRGITVNAVQPGPTETDINDIESQRAMLRPMMALGRMGKDWEVASLVAYLAGPQAGFITGSLLTIDGGYTA